MAKTALEKALEKQTKENQKVARDAKKRGMAQSIVAGAMFVAGFRVMDEESEVLLQEILTQYDGNENNYVNFSVVNLPNPIAESVSVGYEKLKQYGMLLSVREWISGSGITLSESGKKYFENKERAYDQAAAKKGTVNVNEKVYQPLLN